MKTQDPAQLLGLSWTFVILISFTECGDNGTNWSYCEELLNEVTQRRAFRKLWHTIEMLGIITDISVCPTNFYLDCTMNEILAFFFLIYSKKYDN